MRLPRVRFTVRRLMVAVASVALATGGWRLWERREDYRRQAANFADLEAAFRQDAEQRADIKFAESLRGLAAESGRVRAQYQRAARYPWLGIPPDTPRSAPMPRAR